MGPGKWQPFCHGLNVSKYNIYIHEVNVAVALVHSLWSATLDTATWFKDIQYLAKQYSLFLSVLTHSKPKLEWH